MIGDTAKYELEYTTEMRSMISLLENAIQIVKKHHYAKRSSSVSTFSLTDTFSLIDIFKHIQGRAPVCT